MTFTFSSFPAFFSQLGFDPIVHFTVQKPQYPTTVEFYGVQKGRSTDFEALNLGNVRNRESREILECILIRQLIPFDWHLSLSLSFSLELSNGEARAFWLQAVTAWSGGTSKDFVWFWWFEGLTFPCQLSLTVISSFRDLSNWLFHLHSLIVYTSVCSDKNVAFNIHNFLKYQTCRLSEKKGC